MQTVFIGFLLTSLFGCSPNTEISPTPGDVPIPPENWTIQLHRTGGFAGVDDTLTLDDDGELTVSSADAPQEVRSPLPAGEIARIQGLLQQAYPFTGPARPSDCRDCFNYALVITWEERSYQLQMDDLNIPAQIAPLLDKLIEIMQAALAG